ncbi:hypothetical protein DRQ36_10505, partial [bacterium]
IDFNELAASPAAPSAGFGRLYTKSDDRIYFQDDGGTEYDLTSTGGPPSTVYWIEEPGGTYIYPEGNTQARVYDIGQDFTFYYEGDNPYGAFFAGDDVGVIAHRYGEPSSEIPNFIWDEYPFNDIGSDGSITSADEVTYTGIYAYGDIYNAITGIAELDCGVRGIGLDDFGGTCSSWPLVGVLGEVVEDGAGDYGQQGVYGWQSCSPGAADYCIGVYGRSSQTGFMSAGVLGQYTSTVGDPIEGFDGLAAEEVWGALGYEGRTGVYGYTDVAAGYGVYSYGNSGIENSSNPTLFFYDASTWGGFRWDGTNMQYNNNGGGWFDIAGAAGADNDWAKVGGGNPLITDDIYHNGNVTIGAVTAANEMLEVNGAVIVGAATGTNTGAIQWNGTHFQGYNGSGWVDLDAGAGGSQWSDSTTFITNDNATAVTDHVRVFDNGDLEVGDGELRVKTVGAAGSFTVDIGSATTTEYLGPFGTLYNNGKTQLLYLQSEIGGATSITDIGFNISTVGSPSNLTNMTITMMHYAPAVLPTNFVDLSAGTVVFGPSNYSLPGVTGWFTIDISDFAYNGSDNLIVEIYWGPISYSSDYYVTATSTSPNYRMTYGRSDTETPPLYDGQNYERPDIRLECTGGASTKLTVVDGYVEFPELSSAPATPSSNYGRLYEKDDGKIYFKDDGGTEYDLTGGGAIALDDLTDVTVSGVTEGDILYYDGTEWVNLGRGSDGQVLTSTATSVEWADNGGGGGSGTQRVWTFDSDLEDWTATAECTYPYTWVWDSDGGAGAAFADDVNAYASELLVSPVLNVSTSNTITLNFIHRYNLENTYDEGYVAYRLDSGDWVEISAFTTGDYNAWQLVNNDPLYTAVPCGGRSIDVFTGDCGGYMTSEVDIDVSTANTIEIAFLLTTDSGTGDEGWFIDKVTVSGLTPNVAMTFTERWDALDPGASGTWSLVDLAAFGVEPGDICEIIICNSETNTENQGGVRSKNSVLDRLIDLQEAEAGGQSCITMKAQVEIGTTEIGLYEEDNANMQSYLTGYWR